MLGKPNKYNFTSRTMKQQLIILLIVGLGLFGNPAHAQVLADSSKLLKPNEGVLDEVVVTGTLKEVKRVESPVPVEVYTAAFLKKNPAFHIFEGLLHINGVRPQNNCNICNTGEIRINGLPGPYTMVLIDGMPIMSSLSTVYGFE